MSMQGIFISYRREDAAAYAGRLYDSLVNHFGKKNVFIDIDSIEQVWLPCWTIFYQYDRNKLR
jgi:hypothetical protein